MQFLPAENESASEIHRRIQNACVRDCTPYGSVFRVTIIVYEEAVLTTGHELVKRMLSFIITKILINFGISIFVACTSCLHILHSTLDFTSFIFLKSQLNIVKNCTAKRNVILKLAFQLKYISLIYIRIWEHLFFT